MVKKYRMDLHQIPEIGFKEFETQKYLLNVISKYKNCMIYKINTGIVLFFNKKKDITIALRADMDALPLIEKTNLEFKSKNYKMMHACGHDGHMAMLLAASDYIDQNFDNLNKNIVIIFQPSEELAGGANLIIDSKILEQFNIDEIYGFHIWPNLEKGKIFSREKEMMANSCEVDIKISGKSVHAASHKQGIDALYAGCMLVKDIYDMESKIDNKIIRLVKFGEFHSGTIRNIISNETNISGTIRTYDDNTLNYIINSIKDIGKKYEKSMDVKISYEFRNYYSSVINDSILFNKLLNLGIKKLDNPVMQAEDFGNYLKKYKGVFMFLGAGDTMPLHNSMFDFDMNILYEGLEFYKKIINM